MKNKTILNSIRRFVKLIFIKLFRIHDTPQKIALGFGAGVALGIFPGTGPLASLFCAFIFKLNRASALLASLLTNTWLSFATFLLSVKIGASVLGKDSSETRLAIKEVIKNFHFKDLFNVSVFEVLLPLLVGYLVVALCLGLVAYLTILIIIKLTKKSAILKKLRKDT